MEIMKGLGKIIIAVLIGTAICGFIFFLSYIIFGDLTKDESLKPLLVIVPVLIIGAFIYRDWMKRN